MASDVQELLDQLREDGVEDSVVSDLETEFQNLRSGSLRKKLGEQAKRISDLEGIEAKFLALEAQPQRKAALKAANVDYDTLPKAIRTLIDKELSDFSDPEKVAEFVTEYELPTSQGEPQTPEQSPAQAIQAHGQQVTTPSVGATDDRAKELQSYLDKGDVEGFVKYSSENPEDTPIG